MKLVYCGTPEFAVPTLKVLHNAGHEIALVVSQPDRPVGRHQELTAPPVKKLAQELGLPVSQPEKIRDNAEFRAQLEAIAPEAIIVVAYGRIIPPWMLQLPRFGCINLHASLLPKLRGAAPIQWAVANGASNTGNTTMLLEEGLDTGPILLQQHFRITRDIKATELAEAMARTGGTLMIETLKSLVKGDIIPRPQDEAQATLAPILTRENGRLDVTAANALQIKNRWRGFYPWPGVFLMIQGKKFLIHNMEQAQIPIRTGPGELLIKDNRILVSCADESWLELLEVQLEGKKRLKAAEFLRGNTMQSGTIFSE